MKFVNQVTNFIFCTWVRVSDNFGPNLIFDTHQLLVPLGNSNNKSTHNVFCFSIIDEVVVVEGSLPRNIRSSYLSIFSFQ